MNEKIDILNKLFKMIECLGINHNLTALVNNRTEYLHIDKNGKATITQSGYKKKKRRKN